MLFSGDEDDVYNFDLGASTGSKKKKKKKKKKKEVKAPTMSKEDRIASILKRMGSNLTEEFIKSGGETDVADADPESPSIPPVILEEEDSPLKVDAYVESSEDSLGMEEADFEVGTYARRKVVEKQEIRRINSENFTVDLSALEKAEGIEQRDERYRNNKSASIFSAESDNMSTSAAVDDQSGVSQFERMKSVFSMPLESDSEKEESEENYEDDDFEEVETKKPPAAPVISVNTNEEVGMPPSSSSYPIGLLSPNSEALADQVIKDVEENKAQSSDADDHHSYDMDDFSDEETKEEVKAIPRTFTFEDVPESKVKTPSSYEATAHEEEEGQKEETTNTNDIVPESLLHGVSSESCPGLTMDDISVPKDEEHVDRIGIDEPSVQQLSTPELSKEELDAIEMSSPPPPPPPIVDANFNFDKPLVRNFLLFF